MKKVILATLLIGMMGSCNKPNVPVKRTNYLVFEEFSPLKLIVIDSCQYLFGDYGSSSVLTHKGNCSNPIHKGGNK
jgi:hypothetical protein